MDDLMKAAGLALGTIDTLTVLRPGKLTEEHWQMLVRVGHLLADALDTARAIHYIDRDDDGNWYVVPVDVEVQWLAYLKDSAEYWDITYPSAHQGKPPIAPHGVYQIAGDPSLVRFREYVVDAP